MAVEPKNTVTALAEVHWQEELPIPSKVNNAAQGKNVAWFPLFVGESNDTSSWLPSELNITDSISGAGRKAFSGSTLKVLRRGNTTEYSWEAADPVSSTDSEAAPIS